MFKQISLAVRISFVMITMVVIIMVAGLFTMNFLVSRNVERMVEASGAQLVSAKAESISRIMETSYRELNLLSLQDAMVLGTREETERYLGVTRGKVSPIVSNILYVWPDGMSLTPAGTYVDTSTRDYFKAIFSDGQDFFISAPIVSKGTGKPAIIQAKAIKDRAGSTRAIVGFDTGLDVLSTITDTININSHGFGWLTDSTGTVIAYPDKEQLLTLNLTDSDKHGYKGRDSLAKEMLGQDSGVGFYEDMEGNKIVTFYSKVAGTPGWILGVDIPLDRVNESQRQIFSIISLVQFAGLLVAAFIVLLMARSIVRPLRISAQGFRDLAKGDADLTKKIEVTRGDEIGQLSRDFNEFLSKLRAIVGSIKDVQQEMTGLSEDLGKSARDLSDNGDYIASRISEVNAQARKQYGSVDEVSGAVTQIARTVESLESLIQTQSASITEASASIEEMVGNTLSIGGSIEKIGHEFGIMSKSSDEGIKIQTESRERIEKISQQSDSLMEANKTIAQIASQTNLLAMNAAIEAAHAGEAGKGFSVVADEIRKLAETAAMQSRTIGSELKSVLDIIQSVVSSSKDSEMAFNALAGRISTTNTLVREVQQALAEQKVGSSQILQALEDMNQISSQVRLGSTEISSGNKSIIYEMEQLRLASIGISENMDQISNESKHVVDYSKTVLTMAENTGQMVHRMEDAIGKFKI